MRTEQPTTAQHHRATKGVTFFLLCVLLIATAAAQTQLKEQDGQFNLLTNGLNIHINDTSTNQDLIRFQEGGTITIPHADLSMGTQLNNISNFFSNACSGSNEVVKQVWANGSYKCNTIPEDTGTENLSQTLTAGNTANQSIDMDRNAITNIGAIGTDFDSSGGLTLDNNLNLSGDEIKDVRDLEGDYIISPPQMAPEAVEIAALDPAVDGRYVETAGDTMNGRALGQTGFLNPDGASLGIGGGLSIGNNDLTAVNRVRFSRGIDIGNHNTVTGTKNVQTNNNFTLDSNSEWRNRGTIDSGLRVKGGGLELNATGETYQTKWRINITERVPEGTLAVQGIAVNGQDIYLGMGDGELIKYDPDGNLVWNISHPGGSVTEIISKENRIYLLTGTSLVKYADRGDSVEKIWTQSLSASGAGLSIERENVYVARGSELEKFVDKGDTATSKWNISALVDVEVRNSNIYTFSDGGLTKFVDEGASAREVWNKSLPHAGAVVAVEENRVYAGTEYYGGGEIVKFLDEGTTATEKWQTTIGDYANDLVVENNDVYVSYTYDYADTGPFRKYRDKGDTVEKKWDFGPDSSVDGIGVDNGVIYAAQFVDTAGNQGGDNFGDLIKLEDVENFKQSGNYSSDVFDAGSVEPFPEVTATSFLPARTTANVTLFFDNSSSFGSPVEQTLQVNGGAESRLVGTRAQYVKFHVNLSASVEDTPELRKLVIPYGKTAATYGYNQIALGQSATTDATGAVAIGHDANAPNSYEATFGNLQGDELDVNVTGNATVHGRLAVGNNSLSGLVPGDINVSSIYYDYSVAKSPVVQCSQGSDWCHVTVPEQQDSFYVKKGDSFDKDRPRATAAEVVNASAVDAWQELQAVKAENRRQDRQIKQLTAVICQDQPNASVCR